MTTSIRWIGFMISLAVLLLACINYSQADKFPFNDFLKISGIRYWENIRFENKEFECESQQACQCGEGCMDLGDCCIDYLWNTTQPDSNVSEHKQMLLQKAKPQSCQQFFPKMKYANDHFIMIDTCLPDTDSRVLQMCQSDDEIPVFGEMFMYKNKYCAKCNNVKFYEFLEMDVKCPFPPPVSVTDIDEIFLMQRCVLIPSKRTIRQYIHKCQPNRCSREKATLCRIFRNDISFFYQSYVNVFCGDCLVEIENGVIEIGLNGPEIQQWSKKITLVSFDNTKTDCPQDEVKDILGRCTKKEFICGPGYTIHGKACVQTKVTSPKNPENTKSTFQNCIHSNKASLFVLSNRTLNNIRDLETRIEINLNLTNTTWERVRYGGDHQTVIRTTISYTQEIKTRLLEISKTNLEPVERLFINSLTSSIHQSLTYGTDYTRAFKNNRICASIQKLPASKISFLRNDSCQLIKSSDGNLIHRSFLNFEIDFSKGEFKEHFYFCRQFHLHSSCLRENIIPEKYGIDANHTLSFKAAGITYAFNVSEYVPTLHGFQICLNNRGTGRREKFSWYDTTQRAEYYISITGTVFSFFGYLILFIAFYFIRELRNTGGIYILILAVTLFTVDIIFILSTQIEQYTTACKWIGILLHGFSLLTCKWTIVVAVDLALQFTRAPVRASKSKKSIGKKCLYCIGATIAVVAVILGLNESGTLHFNYEVSCWIGDVYLKLAFFFLPVVVVYVLCITCLTVIICTINRQHHQSKTVLTSGKPSKCQSPQNRHQTNDYPRRVRITGISTDPRIRSHRERVDFQYDICSLLRYFEVVSWILDLCCLLDESENVGFLQIIFLQKI